MICFGIWVNYADGGFVFVQQSVGGEVPDVVLEACHGSPYSGTEASIPLSYRPLVLTSVTCNMMQRIVSDRLICFLRRGVPQWVFVGVCQLL